MDKKDSQEITDTMLIADALLQIKALSNLLISKGLLSKEELEKEVGVLTKQIMDSLLQKANITIQ
jgi:hypothetical protein